MVTKDNAPSHTKILLLLAVLPSGAVSLLVQTAVALPAPVCPCQQLPWFGAPGPGIQVQSPCQVGHVACGPVWLPPAPGAVGAVPVLESREARRPEIAVWPSHAAPGPSSPSGLEVSRQPQQLLLVVNHPQVLEVDAGRSRAPDTQRLLRACGEQPASGGAKCLDQWHDGEQGTYPKGALYCCELPQGSAPISHSPKAGRL